ncbi:MULTISPECIES: cold-shock protein [Streptomyces]|nr:MULTISPECIES: cold shock domain-containing protein [Streptomyces]MBB4157536.1 CspA family cold shock protein [Streptomyces cinereoruber]NIH62311.1 CspA family cold shock protein [Streptomyces cinereoruber]
MRPDPAGTPLARVPDAEEEAAVEGRSKGFVQSFNRLGGYGFVVPVGSREQVWFSAEDIEDESRTVSEGQQVSFVLVLGDGRFEAKELRL